MSQNVPTSPTRGRAPTLAEFIAKLRELEEAADRHAYGTLAYLFERARISAEQLACRELT